MRKLLLVAALPLFSAAAAEPYTVRIVFTPDLGQTMKGSQEVTAKQIVTIRDNKGVTMNTITANTVITDAVQRAMRAEANNVCVPTQPIAAGTSWRLTSDEVNDCFGGLGEPAGTSSGSGTLKSVDGGYATIEFRFSMHIQPRTSELRRAGSGRRHDAISRVARRSR